MKLNETPAPPIRALLAGDSGTGKTGAIASLVLAGYNVHFADFDNGHEILRNVLIAKDASSLARVDVEVFRDEYKMSGATPVPKDARAWTKGITWLQTTFDKGLTSNDIVVVDSLSFAAKCAMNYVLKINGRLAAPPWPADWGEAQRLVENAVAAMSDEQNAHIICTCHIAQVGGKRIERVGKGADAETIVIDEGPVRRLPAMIGKAINPVIPRYFNHMLLCQRVGVGTSAKRTFSTVPQADFELKNTNPGVIRPEYPLATGLADYFKDARGLSPTLTQAA